MDKLCLYMILYIFPIINVSSIYANYQYSRDESPFLYNSIPQLQDSIDQRLRLRMSSPTIGKRRGFLIQFTMTSFGYNWKTKGSLKGKAYYNMRYETQLSYASPYFLHNLFRIRLKLNSQYTPSYVNSSINPSGDKILSSKDYEWTGGSYTWRAEIGLDITHYLSLVFKDPNLINISLHYNQKISPNHLLIYEVVTEVFLGKKVSRDDILLGQPWHKSVITLEHIWTPVLTLPDWIKKISMYTEYGIVFHGTEALTKDPDQKGKLKFDRAAFIGFNIDWKLDFQFTDNFKISLPSFEFKFQGIDLRPNQRQKLVFPFAWDVDIITAVMF